MVNMIIDGKHVSAEENITIMEAAERNGIPIPKLCYLKGINEIAACRVCVVELEGKTDHLLQQSREGRHGHPYEQPEGPESQKKYGPAAAVPA